MAKYVVFMRLLVSNIFDKYLQVRCYTETKSIISLIKTI